ncbi:hypothetical protein BpHYR1_016725 [Brachionus plicatilis]|uniref:Uncharacterized protein n=1 Tax=Brachionus plicatilis TaxID=10195 RepID=A0A3M7QKH9_BRAPC|nr:hypothetical protein BpHYR1_016725 [Brachionus plicatilis]
MHNSRCLANISATILARLLIQNGILLFKTIVGCRVVVFLLTCLQKQEKVAETKIIARSIFPELFDHHFLLVDENSMRERERERSLNWICSISNLGTNTRLVMSFDQGSNLEMVYT